MLAMNFDQFFTECLQRLQGHRPVVDIGFGAPVLINDAPDQALLVAIQFVFRQPGFGQRRIRQIEFKIDFGTFTVRTDITGIGAIAQCQTQCGQ